MSPVAKMQGAWGEEQNRDSDTLWVAVVYRLEHSRRISGTRLLLVGTVDCCVVLVTCNTYTFQFQKLQEINGWIWCKESLIRASSFEVDSWFLPSSPSSRTAYGLHNHGTKWVGIVASRNSPDVRVHVSQYSYIYTAAFFQVPHGSHTRQS